jgi:uncharacterized protein (TIGR01619 family)
MNNPRTDGLSSSDESERLFEIEDGLIAALSDKANFKYVGRLTNDSKRFLYLYVSDSILIDKIVSEYMIRYQDYQFDVDSRVDKNWSIYLDFLYPSPKEYQSLMNRRVIEQLEDGGDNLTKTREVYHWIYFKTNRDRELFLDKISSDGFSTMGIANRAGCLRYFTSCFYPTPPKLLLRLLEMIKLKPKTKAAACAW